ncbi:MAG: hypothetical protein H6622_09675 [Halobacteriovoraceae bacterium]|nr:hypothetical protein [Halobacteriovoraceae bacterium]
MKWKFKSFFLFVVLTNFALGLEKSNSFVITMYDHSVKVVSPNKGQKNPGLIVRNKTLGPIRARIERNNSEILGHMMIPPQKDKSIDLEYRPGYDLRFIPLSPPFQDVKLMLGKKAYEIPPKK